MHEHREARGAVTGAQGALRAGCPMSFGVSSSPISLPEPPEWRDRAACRGLDTNLWFPDDTPRSSWAAKQICKGCEVRLECLQAALDTPRTYGIWGGLSERQRQDLRRADQIVVEHGTRRGYNAHLRRRERACEQCRAAHARHMAETRRQR